MSALSFLLRYTVSPAVKPPKVSVTGPACTFGLVLAGNGLLALMGAEVCACAPEKHARAIVAANASAPSSLVRDSVKGPLVGTDLAAMEFIKRILVGCE